MKASEDSNLVYGDKISFYLIVLILLLINLLHHPFLNLFLSEVPGVVFWLCGATQRLSYFGDGEKQIVNQCQVM